MIEWIPNKEGLNELTLLFKESMGINNEKHREIFEKIDMYSKSKEFTNYLIFILNDETSDEPIRQIAGLTLKGIMERNFIEITIEGLEYFKSHIFYSYLDEKATIRKIITNLVNTYIRKGGIDLWPEILEILINNLENEIGVSMALETINIVVEDSGIILEEKYSQFVSILAEKLANLINSLYLEEESKINEKNKQLLILALTALYLLIENCSEIINKNVEIILKTLLLLNNSTNYSIRFRVARSWNAIIRIRTDVFLAFYEQLFSFFAANLFAEYYEMNFSAGEFYLFLLEEENANLLKNNEIFSHFKSDLRKILPYFLHYTKLTQNDICGIDNKNFISLVKNKINNVSPPAGSEDSTFDEEVEEDDTESYNPNWTLRKCCSKILDKVSNIFPDIVIELLKPYLENDIQANDWIVKERSILTLGAIGVGCYEYLKKDLNVLTLFLNKELSHQNKLVRAISCWSISRFSNFILNQNKATNAEELIRLFLSELLRRFLDKEAIVQEASCVAFNSFIHSNKYKLSQYIKDIMNIVSSVFEKYHGNSLLTLYETITLMTENYEEDFKNVELVQELFICILKKWYTTIGNDSLSNNVSNLAIFDLLSAIIKVSGSLMLNYFNDFLDGSLRLIENNFHDKDVICKCIDLISVLCQSQPEFIKNSKNKDKIVEIIYKIITHYPTDLYSKQYVLALIGDICKVDTKLLYTNIDFFIVLLIEHIELPEKKTKVQLDLISVCNNSCWTIGLLALAYKENMSQYVDEIMEKLTKILKAPKLNKSLAQNISICIGRIALVLPEKIEKHINVFLKQFCLSLKFVSDSIEKQEAFNGLCKAITLNPNGVMNHFAFFCDAVCQYDNAPQYLENMFQNIIFSYKKILKENWGKYVNSFPAKLKNKISFRFSIE